MSAASPSATPRRRAAEHVACRRLPARACLGRGRGGLAVLLAWLLSGCGLLLQRADVSRQFSGRFGCQTAKVTSVGGGYRVDGCGMTADYVCVPSNTSGHHHHEHSSSRGAGDEVLGALVFGVLFAGMDENCHLAYAQQGPSTPMPVASSAPGPVRGSNRLPGERVLSARILFAGGSLSVRAKPREHPAHVLLGLHSVWRLPEHSCNAEIFHDGLPVEIVEQQRVGAYDVQLLVPVSALRGAEQAVRFAGTLCGREFELDGSGRATLGLFAARFQEELTRLESMTAGAAVSGSAQ